MNNVTVGQITSEPDANGNHQLKCPGCRSEFSAPITRNDNTQELNNTVCDKCGYSAEPIMFLYHANKEQTDKMVSDYAMSEIEKIFGQNKHIKIGRR